MALVLVLWVITLLSVIAASFSLGVRRDAGVAHHLAQATVAEVAAEAGLRFAMLGLLHPDPALRWVPGEPSRAFQWGDIRVQVKVTSESGRVDLNHAGRGLLERLLAAVGVEDPSRRDAVVVQILDWRDSAVGTRPGGLSRADYRALGLPYGPANRPFQDVSELLLLPAVNADLFRRLEPFVTTLSGQSGVDPEFAEFEVLLALMDLDAARAEALIAERQLRWERRAQGRPDLAGGRGDVHTVTTVAESPDGVRAALRFVIEVAAQDHSEPFRILRFDPWVRDRDDAL